MISDILVILLMAFGLFAISMFILFYVYLKRSYNKRHLNDDYTKESINYEKDETLDSKNNDDEFIPKKKK